MTLTCVAVAGLLVVWRGERQPQRWVEGQQEARPRLLCVRCEHATGDPGRCDESTGEGDAEQAVSAAATCSLCELYTPGGRHSFVVRRARPTSREWLGELQMCGYGMPWPISASVLDSPSPPPHPRSTDPINLDCPCSARMHVQGSIT